MRHGRSRPDPSALRLTVHPGLGKTATTSAQRVLRAHPRLWFGGVASHQPDHAFRRAFEALLREPVERHGLPSVTVLPLEALAERPAAFWEELSRIVGVEVPGAGSAPSNRRRDDGHRWRTRTVANRPVARIGTSALFERLVAPAPERLRGRMSHTLQARSGDGATVKLSPELLERIDATYADDLDLLQPRCPFDLRALGYPGTDRPDGGTSPWGRVS